MAIISVRAQPTITAGAPYAAGRLLGTLMQFQHESLKNLECYLHSLIVVDEARQNSAMDIYFFEREPTATGFGIDNGVPMDVDDNEMETIFAYVPVLAANYSNLADNSLAMAIPPFGPAPFRTPGVGAVYAFIVARGTPTYVAATDIRVIARFMV